MLGDVSVILAEDTRHTRKLLSHYGIATPLLSYHQHNKRARVESILDRLRHQDVALVSNAGMPAVSDPGFELIQAVVNAGIDVDVLPGASAAITAIVAAALPAPGFLFAGFLPRRALDRRRRLGDLARLPYSLVLYEAPHRLLPLLQDLLSVLGDRELVLGRELTKLHQEIVRGTISEAIERYSAVQPRGEFTVVLAPFTPEPADVSQEALEELRRRRSGGEEARIAVADVSARYGLSRNETYRLWVEAASD